MGTVIGRIVDGDQVEQVILDMLQLRYGTYLDEVAQQRGHQKGRAAYQSPRSWIVVKDFDKWPENKLPCVIVVSPGMAEPPRKRGDGSYDATWEVIVAVIVEARTKKASHTLGMRYGAAMAKCMLSNNADLGGALEGTSVTEWLGEDYADLPMDEERNLHATRNVFNVEVKNVMNAYKAPVEYLPDEEDTGHSPDYGDEPTADPEKLSVDVTTEFGEEDAP